MDPKTYYLGTKEEIDKDLESKIQEPFDAIKYTATFGAYGIIEALAGGALMYIGQLMPDIIPPVFEAAGLVACLDVMQRGAYGGVKAIKYVADGRLKEAKKATEDDQKLEYMKSMNKELLMPGIVGWTKKYGEWIEKERSKKMVTVTNSDADFQTKKYKDLAWKVVEEYTRETGYIMDSFFFGLCNDRVNVADKFWSPCGAQVKIEKGAPPTLYVNIIREDFHDRGMDLAGRIEEETGLDIQVDLKYLND